MLDFVRMPPRRPATSPPRPRPSEPTREPDADYLADLEQADGQKWKRRAASERGKRVKPPEPRQG
jgi:hypothetical protein